MGGERGPFKQGSSVRSKGKREGSSAYSTPKPAVSSTLVEIEWHTKSVSWCITLIVTHVRKGCEGHSRPR